ncbi:PREDICTED: N-acetylglucosamine-1-phosphotransferase subunits alpha/beta-like [Rhagoletis zephyria]|uniref:N-acetylglucosamine-1-phosphotransferase subunits alpha/beta-like n=1 Tax=Rhagoletis zephyria TaxID=28612 RepID=UPI0008115B3F|nr:PREDICTED: N-acetylglucosamine-1-phosphotransferase subunits alpha/beta-like [Rhagoletis zephyria]
MLNKIFLVNENLIESSDYGRVADVCSTSGDSGSGVPCQQKHRRSSAAIDAVYTWVNGSDEGMQAEMLRISNQLSAETLRQFCYSETTVPSWTAGNNSSNSSCFLLPLMLLRPPLAHPHHHFDDVLKFEKWNDSSTVIYLHSLDAARTLGASCVRVIADRLYKLTNLYSCTGTGDVNAHLELITIFGLTTTATSSTEQDCDSAWSDPLKSRLPGTAKQLHSLEVEPPNVFLYTTKFTITTTVQWLNFSKIVSLLQAKENLQNASSERCNFVSTHPLPVLMTDVGFFEHQLESESVRRNRFADNDELRYSLRSLERFAPWIRNVFLVTNGQIPRWLNVEHPRLRIVQHRDIFANQSHLPTFSSSAIECHLHRIAGVSPQFLYLNDDIILGKPIYPDDFYTESRGFKVYLSWPVPNCAQGCPLNWLNDGYCDKACNSSKCLWDGGDCLRNGGADSATGGNNSAASTAAYSHHYEASATNSELCAPNCLTNWLGDGFCDQVCNNENCAYDMADCGVTHLEGIARQIEVNQSANVYTYQPDNNSTVLLLNLTQLCTVLPVGEQHYQVKLTGAQYRNVSTVFSAVLNLKHSILTVLLRPNISENHEPLAFTLLAKINQKTFNFSLYVEVQKDSKGHTVRKDIEETNFNLPQLIQWLEANASLARQQQEQQRWNTNSPSTDQTMVITLPTVTQGQTSFSLPCSAEIDAMSGEVRQKFEQIRRQLNRGLVTDTGQQYFNSLLKQLYADIICSTTATNDEQARTEKLQTEEKEPEGAMNQFIEQYLLADDVVHNESSYRSRRLLDAYADSLIYVNHMYNQVFGVQSRQVVAHMPHYVDVDIIRRMQERFADRFAHTSASQFRNSEDMQFSFSYFHFLMSETEECTAEEALRQFDTDQSGRLSLNELKTLAIHMVEQLPLTEENSLLFFGDLRNCSLPPECHLPPVNGSSSSSGRSIWQQELPVDLPIDQLLNCTFLREKIASKWPKRNRNRFETLNDDEVAFKMLRSNATVLEEELDELRRVRKKFICLNDNLEHGVNHTADAQLHGLLQKFFSSLLPVPSAFERPPGQENRLLYIDQYREWKEGVEKKSGLYFGGSYLFVLINVILFIILLK